MIVVGAGGRRPGVSAPRRAVESSAATVALIGAGVLTLPIGLAWAVDRYDYDVWGAFLWGPLLLLACLPLCRWAAGRSGQPELVRFFMGAAVLKIVVGSLLRYGSAAAFYGGVADAAAYDNAAASLTDQFRRLDFSGLGSLSGTRAIDVLTGVVQAVIGQTRFGTFFVFSAFGFVGMVLLYLAFCETVPDGDRRLLRLLLFLTPSVWFWPSSIGKEAFMLLCLGAAAFGVARLLHGHLLGAFPAVLGVGGTLVVRPHLSLAFFAGLLLAAPSLGRRLVGGHRPLLSRLLLPVLVVVALPLVVGRVEEFFHIDTLDPTTTEQVLANVQARTTSDRERAAQAAVANDADAGPRTLNPAKLAVGALAVLVRPYPWESTGIQGLASSLEALVVVGFSMQHVVRRAGRLATWLRERFVRVALGYSIAFAVAFTAVSNLGILARQRSLLFPFLFVVVALPLQRAETDSSAGPHPRVVGAWR